MLTQLNNVKTNYNRNQEEVDGGSVYTGTGDKWKNDVYINGPVFGFGLFGEGLSYVLNPAFYSNPIAYNVTAGGISYGGEVTSIPIQIRYTED